jgi:hypothetical protein
MFKQVTFVAVIAGMSCTAAAAQAPGTVPTLSGHYVYSASENCPSGADSLHQLSGTLTFDPAAGTAKLDAYVVIGGQPIILRIRSKQTYTNSATDLSLDSNTYHIAYGAVEGGVATYASFIGLIQDASVTCGYQGTITLQ